MPDIEPFIEKYPHGSLSNANFHYISYLTPHFVNFHSIYSLMDQWRDRGGRGRSDARPLLSPVCFIFMQFSVQKAK